MEIQLLIKAPNQNVEDHIVHCNLDWTVENLKDHLSETYPNKPNVKEQKLIYAGRLLLDHLHLKDILRHEDSESSVHILHLVCKGDSSAHHEQPSYSNQMWHNQSTSHSQVMSDINAGPSSENALSHRNVSSVPPTNTFYPQFYQGQGLTPPAAMPVFLPDSQVAAQIAAMQQMYAYYFTQYIQSINTPASVGNGPMYPDDNHYQEPHAVSNEVPAQRQLNQRINDQGGQILEENDEFGNRDWLDHLFLCCRFLILFCIVYFYSTPERLMIVIVCAIIAFLYHEGWFARWANPAVPVHVLQENPNHINVPPDYENENDPSLVNQDLSANDELHDEHELEATMDGDDPPHGQHPDFVNNNHFSPLTLLSTFFSSLIPEPPPPVNIN